MSDNKLLSSDVITYYCGICVSNNVMINHHIHQVNCIIILVKTLTIQVFSFKHL